MKVLFSLLFSFSPLFAFAAGNAIQEAAAIDAQLATMGAAVICGSSTTATGGITEASQKLNAILGALKPEIEVSLPVFESFNESYYQVTTICVTVTKK